MMLKNALNFCRLNIKLRWRHLLNVQPIILFFVMARVYGWLAPATLVCAAFVPICNWPSVWAGAKLARRRPLDAIACVCGIAALACLFVFSGDMFAHRSKEDPVTWLPTGFSFGEYRDSLWDDAPPVEYGLYVPPHLKNEKGPFPLIVFMNGFGQRTKEKMFDAGLGDAIKKSIRKGDDQKFEFVTFVPLDPTGHWRQEKVAFEDVVKALDYVIRHHKIDPKRVYLTGMSTGGNGVWQLAENYPDKWAAIAPLSSFYHPNVDKVRQIPTFIFQGAKDKVAPVEPTRTLVKKLKAVGADVQYREMPNRAHDTWTGTYTSDELFNWFKQKSKD